MEIILPALDAPGGAVSRLGAQDAPERPRQSTSDAGNTDKGATERCGYLEL